MVYSRKRAISFTGLDLSTGKIHMPPGASQVDINGDHRRRGAWRARAGYARLLSLGTDNPSSAVTTEDFSAADGTKLCVDGDWRSPVGFLLSTESDDDAPKTLSGQGISTELEATGLFKVDPRAALFDGVDQYLSVADDASLDFDTGDFSICFWVRIEGTVGGTHLVHKFQDANNQYRVFVSAGGLMSFQAVIASSVVVSMVGTTVLSADTWYFVTIVVDRSTAANCKVYLDGADDTSGTPTTGATDIANTGAFQLGRSGADAAYLDGRMESVGVWKGTAISSSVVTSIYNGGAGKRYDELTAGEKTNLSSWWQLQEASGSRADSQGSNTLSDNNGVTQDEGRVFRLTFADDQYSQIVVKSSAAVLIVRATSSGHYRAVISGTSVIIYSITPPSTSTAIGAASLATSLQSNDVVRLEVIGSTVTLKVNGVTVLTATDSAFTEGTPGFALTGFSEAVDDYEAGDILSVPSPVAVSSSPSRITAFERDDDTVKVVVAHGATVSAFDAGEPEWDS